MGGESPGRQGIGLRKIRVTFSGSSRGQGCHALAGNGTGSLDSLEPASPPDVGIGVLEGGDSAGKGRGGALWLKDLGGPIFKGKNTISLKWTAPVGVVKHDLA